MSEKRYAYPLCISKDKLITVCKVDDECYNNSYIYETNSKKIRGPKNI